MNEQNIEEQHRQIGRLLGERRLKEALTLLEPMVGACADWNLANELQDTQRAYQYMLQYMRQGYSDPQRGRVYMQLTERVYRLSDQARMALLDGLSSRYYFTIRQQQKRLAANNLRHLLSTLEPFADNVSICKLMPNNRQELLSLLHTHEEALKQLFLSVWTSAHWTSEDVAHAGSYLQSDRLRSIDLSLLASAVTLSLLCLFDEAKLNWLFKACAHPDNQVRMRALVGLVLTLNTYPHRVSLLPHIPGQLTALEESAPRLKAHLCAIYLQLLQSRYTEQVGKKMREEIMPEMIKGMKEYHRLTEKLGMDEQEETAPNPDWQLAWGETMNSKLQEMDELQKGGADIHFTTFATLKRFPFFQDIHNWFMPYDNCHPAVASQLETSGHGGQASMVELFLQSGVFCHSDRYSMVYLLQQIPHPQRTLLMNQFSHTDIQELLKEENQAIFKGMEQDTAAISAFYVQDLYRFFKLGQHKSEFHDPFSDAFHLHRHPLLKPFLNQADVLRKVADLHFSYGQFDSAFQAYQELADLKEADDSIFQRMGFCLLKSHRYAEAIGCLQKADAIKPDNIWNLKHIARCYRQMGDTGRALSCYAKLEEMQPDNLNIVWAKGCCLVERGSYNEALNCFYRLDFAQENCTKAWRSIAWCSFLTGKDGQAMKYYEKILSAQPHASDYLNAGHAAWCRGDLPRAVVLYRQSAQMAASPTEFREMFLADQHILIERGIAADDIHLMLDLI